MTQGARKYIRGSVAVAGLAVGLIAYGVYSSLKADAKPARGAPGTRTKVKKGRILCPHEMGRIAINPNSVGIGDFVVLRLISADTKFSEEVWGQVQSRSPTGTQFLVELSTPMIATGLTPLRSDKHGFTIGEKVKVDSDCLFDVLHVPKGGLYQIICGVLLTDLGYDSVIGYDGEKTSVVVKPGDFVFVVVGNPAMSSASLPGKTWHELLKISVTSTGKTGSILHGLVWDDPSLTAQHGINKMSKLEFTRDCIVKT